MIRRATFFRICHLAVLLAGLGVSSAWADPPGERHPGMMHGPGRPPWAGLPPEERQQMRQQMWEHWRRMPPEQQEALRQERRAQWQNLTPEEREAMRQEHRARWRQLPPEERHRLRQEMRQQCDGGCFRGGQ